MSASDHRSHGRAVTLLVLGVLLLTVCAAAYLFFVQPARPLVPLERELITTDDEAQHLDAAARRMITLLTILLMSALLILLFVIGAYLVIRIGQLVARTRVGGQPTEYVDAWGKYRVTEEEIEAATAEDERENGPDQAPPERDPDAPPPGGLT